MALTFASNENVQLSGETLLNASQWGVCFWFRVPSKADENHTFFKEQGDQFDRNCTLFLASNNNSFFDPSSFTLQYRADNSNTIETTTDFDDDAWHRALVVRRSSSDHEVFIDGVSEGSDGTDWGTNSGQNPDTFLGTNDAGNNPCTGNMARLAVFVGIVPTVEQAETFLWTGRYSTPPNYWAEMQTTAVRDLSGNGTSFTVTGTSVADHAPVPALGGLGGGVVLVSVGAQTFQPAWAQGINSVIQPGVHP